MKSLKEVGEAFLIHLKEKGLSDRSIYTYNNDLKQIISFFGEDKEIDKILIPHVGRFLKSDELLKKKDLDRAKPTIDKTIRFFRMLMIWAKEQGYIEHLPLPKDMMVKREG